eukprot:scaffold3485_cov259-Chaetoceros_neogracile.AAC.12
MGENVAVPPRQKTSKPKAKKRKVSEDSTLSKQDKMSKSKRKNAMGQAEDEMTNKDAKQNEKRREKERRASYSHLVVPAGTNAINDNGNVNDNGNAHEEVVEEYTVAATELVEEQSITDIDENVTNLAGMPALHSPPPVNSKSKHTQVCESKFDGKWNILFMKLVEYKQKNGHCNVPRKNGSLGRWISTQRNLFTSKTLKEDRYEKLVGIGFTFEDAKVESDNVKWNTRFMELEKYKEKNGHCNCPQKNGSLGSWISTQRNLFTSKKLKADRYEKLDGIGFAFEDANFANLKTQSEHEKWNIRFVELEKYKETNGHCNIPANNGSLGSWVRTQRTLFRTKKLKEDCYEKLVGIGFAFVFDSNIWNRQLMELVKYKEKNGHCNIPCRNGSLGNWIKYQRELFRSNKLKADRYERLVEIGLTFGDTHKRL